jgi:hypothetical protein
MTVTLRTIPAKPLAEYTEAEAAIFRSPAVEDHLRRVRQTLALVTVLQAAHARVEDTDFGHDGDLTRDAADMLMELCRDAWTCAASLSEGLPGRVQGLRVITQEDGDAS